MDARQARDALLDAVNAHDLDAIKSFVDHSYEARNESGMVLMDACSLVDYAALLFQEHPEYREKLAIEDVEEEGDTAWLTTRRTEMLRGHGGLGHCREGRQVETWKQRDGRWFLMGERAANPCGSGLMWLWALNSG